MTSLMSKYIGFNETSAACRLRSNNVFLLYYAPQKYKPILKKNLKAYKLVSLYKGDIKHSLLPLVLKEHFNPSLGIVKFSNIKELNKFLLDFDKEKSNNFSNVILSTIIVNINKVFYFSVAKYFTLKNILETPHFVLHVFKNIFLYILFKLIFIPKCMLISFRYKINANA